MKSVVAEASSAVDPWASALVLFAIVVEWRLWVVSSSIDWGSLGSAEQFRYRLTGGVMINRVEIFAGYEYLDIDRTQLNTYVAGVGIWF